MDAIVSNMRIEKPCIFSIFSTFCGFDSWAAPRWSSKMPRAEHVWL